MGIGKQSFPKFQRALEALEDGPAALQLEEAAVDPGPKIKTIDLRRAARTPRTS